MKLYFKQRLFSWFDSYDIYYEDGGVAFTVEGQLSWGHCLHILDENGVHIATVKEKVLRLLPRFDLYAKESYLGSIQREFSLFVPHYHIDFMGWDVDGSFMEWDYRVTDSKGELVAVISKELFHLTDTYGIDVVQEENALYVLMLVLAIDAEKCSRK